MKSRLTMRLLVVVSVRPSDMKKRGLVTHVSERPAVLPKVYTRSPGQPTKGPFGVARVGRATVLWSSAGSTRKSRGRRLDQLCGCRLPPLAELLAGGSDPVRERGVSTLHVRLEDPLELVDESLAAKRSIQPAVDEHRRDGLLERARQRDPDVGVLALAGAVHDTAHHRDLQVLHARSCLTPYRHLRLEVVRDVARHLLKERRGRPAATRARRDLGHERPQPERLKDLLGDLDFPLPAPAGLRCERDADRVADALVEEDREARGGRDDALVAHPCLGETEMERIV